MERGFSLLYVRDGSTRRPQERGKGISQHGVCVSNLHTWPRWRCVCISASLAGYRKLMLLVRRGRLPTEREPLPTPSMNVHSRQQWSQNAKLVELGLPLSDSSPIWKLRQTGGLYTVERKVRQIRHLSSGVPLLSLSFNRVTQRDGDPQVHSQPTWKEAPTSDRSDL